MKKFAILCALMLATMVSTAGAANTIDLSWANCAFDNTPARTADQAMAGDGSRDGSAPYKLFGVVRTPVGGYPKLAAAQAQLDLQSETGPLSPFWALETGGCNKAYVSAVATRQSTCGTTAANPWVPSTDAVPNILTYTRAGNRAHMEVLVVTLPSSAVDMLSDADYYLFNLAINEDSINNGDPGPTGCVGADLDKVSFVFNSVFLESSAVPFVPGIILNQPGAFGVCATTNGASAGTCAATPTQNKTWGAVKSLYR